MNGSHDLSKPNAMASPQAGAAIVDTESAIERLGGSRTFFQTVVAVFRKDGVAQCAGLLQAVAQRDYPTALRQTHTLKGMAATVGANGLVATATHAEALIKPFCACAQPPDAVLRVQEALAQLQAQLSLALGALAPFDDAP